MDKGKAVATPAAGAVSRPVARPVNLAAKMYCAQGSQYLHSLFARVRSGKMGAP
jgi:hypothetical protein